MAEIEIKGLEKFKRELEQLDFSKRKPALVKGMLRAVEHARAEISAEAPRDTGLLAGRIVAQEDKRESDLNSVAVDVGATQQVFYGFFQEYGTAHHPPQKFFERSIDKAIGQIQDTIVDFIEEEIEIALRA